MTRKKRKNDGELLQDGDEKSTYFIAIRRDPPNIISGTPDQLISQMREDFNVERAKYDRPPITDDAEYMRRTTGSLVRRSGVVPNFQGSLTERYDALKFLGYLHFLGAITSVGATELPVDYDHYNKASEIAPIFGILAQAMEGGKNVN